MRTILGSLFVGVLALLPLFNLPAQEQSQLDTPQQKAEIKHANSYRILFIGDSITRHGCNDDTRQRMKWDHVAGMAASSEEKDYAHTLAQLIQGSLPNRTVEILFHTSGKSGTAAERFATLDKVKPFQPHLVVIQLGEHEQKQTGEASLRDSYDKLIAAFASQSPKPLILCTGTWNPAAAVQQEGRVRYTGWSSLVDAIFQETCDRYGAAFISVAEIAANPTCKGWGEEKGVQWHPNDEGQAQYAARLFAAYQRLQQ